jgi:hypothetical protein
VLLLLDGLSADLYEQRDSCEVAAAFYMTHHWEKGIKKVNDEWWIDYADEKKCTIGWSFAIKERGDIAT